MSGTIYLLAISDRCMPLPAGYPRGSNCRPIASGPIAIAMSPPARNTMNLCGPIFGITCDGKQKVSDTVFHHRRKWLGARAGVSDD
jgi:hypothetical protein